MIKVLSDSYPLTCLAWLDLPGDESPASLALRVKGAHKPLHRCKVLNQEQKMMLGDYNSKSSILDGNPTYFEGQEILDIKNNENGDRLIELCVKNKSSILNTFYKHKDIHKQSYHSIDGVTKRTLDLALTNFKLRKYCVDTRVRNGFDFKSDHRLVVSRFKIPFSKLDRKIIKKKKIVKYDYKNINLNQKKNFIKNLEIQLETNPISSATNIISNLENAQASSIPKIQRSKSAPNPWDNDEELNKLLEERRKFHITNDKHQYREVSKSIKKRVTIIRNIYYENEANRFREVETRKDMESAYKIAKGQSSMIRKKPKAIDCLGLMEQFKNHFNPPHLSTKPTPLQLQLPPPPPKIDPKFTINQLPPDQNEIRSVIKILKNNRSSLDLPAEILKLNLESEKIIDK